MDDEQPSAHRVVVTVVRTGGIAGLRRQWRAQPAPADEPRWRELLASCPWDAPPPAPRGADRYTWRIIAEGGETPREAELPDAGLDGPWRRLIDAVRAAAS